MAAATERDRHAAGDNDSVFANDELLGQVFDDVTVDFSVRESPRRSVPAKPVVTQHRIARVLAEQITIETYASTRPSIERDTDSRPTRHLWPTICIGLMLLGAVLLYRELPASWRAAINPRADSPTTTAHTSSVSQASEQHLRTVSIEDVRVGDRIVGHNPIREQAELVELDPATWRRVNLLITKENGLGPWIELLRPLEWVEEHGAEPGNTIYIEFHLWY